MTTTFEDRPTRYNVEALAQLRADLMLKASESHHDQGTWGKVYGSLVEAVTRRWKGNSYKVARPTTACAAGWTVTAAGAKMLFDVSDLRSGPATADVCLTKDGQVRNIAEYAAKILGLEGEEVDEMFYHTNSTEGVVSMINDIILAARHGLTLDGWRTKLAMADYDWASH
jgi:hypothetical protein